MGYLDIIRRIILCHELEDSSIDLTTSVIDSNEMKVSWVYGYVGTRHWVTRQFSVFYNKPTFKY